MLSRREKLDYLSFMLSYCVVGTAAKRSLPQTDMFRQPNQPSLDVLTLMPGPIVDARTQERMY